MLLKMLTMFTHWLLQKMNFESSPTPVLVAHNPLAVSDTPVRISPVKRATPYQRCHQRRFSAGDITPPKQTSSQPSCTQTSSQASATMVVDHDVSATSALDDEVFSRIDLSSGPIKATNKVKNIPATVTLKPSDSITRSSSESAVKKLSVVSSRRPLTPVFGMNMESPFPVAEKETSFLQATDRLRVPLIKQVLSPRQIHPSPLPVLRDRGMPRKVSLHLFRYY